jgi:nuclear pore complex protein Nup53
LFFRYGTILEAKTSPGSNWMHLKYSNKIEARRALLKNGRLVGGRMMVGVVGCEEEMAREGRLPGAAASQTNLSPVYGSTHTFATPPSTSPGAPLKENVPPPINPEIKSRIRALGLDNSLSHAESQIPKQNSGLVSSALEWLFGW